MQMAERCQEAGRAALHTVPRDQIMHVSYHELVADPAAKVMQIYDRFGYPADAGLAGKIRDWLQAHPSDKHGKHRYQLSDFGLTPEEVRARLEGPELLAASAGE